jgi:hypothetical protein
MMSCSRSTVSVDLYTDILYVQDMSLAGVSSPPRHVPLSRTHTKTSSTVTPIQ